MCLLFLTTALWFFSPLLLSGPFSYPLVTKTRTPTRSGLTFQLWGRVWCQRGTSPGHQPKTPPCSVPSPELSPRQSTLYPPCFEGGAEGVWRRLCDTWYHHVALGNFISFLLLITVFLQHTKLYLNENSENTHRLKNAKVSESSDLKLYV